MTTPGADGEAMLGALADWLASRLGGRPEIEPEGKPGSGYSAENLIITATVGATSHRLVVRRDAVDDPVYPAQAPGLTTGIALQHRVMAALDGVVPVAEIVGVELDPAVLGVPFFVMRYVDGDVPIEDPPYPKAGFFATASPEHRGAMIDDGLRVLARLHATDWLAAGLGDLSAPGTAPGAARQLEVWQASLRGALDGRTSELIDSSLAWLGATPPADPAAEDVVLCWGDARMGNMMWADAECVCVTDFEGASLGPRELDVGWWLMADRHAGVTLGELRWFEVFAALKFATTVVHVMNRWVAKGLVPADHTIWRDNPATEVLADLLEEATR